MDMIFKSNGVSYCFKEVVGIQHSIIGFLKTLNNLSLILCEQEILDLALYIRLITQ